MCLSFSPLSKCFNTILAHVLIPQPDDLTDLLINGGVASRCGHPHLLVEAITDGVGQVDAGVGVASEDGPVSERGKEEVKQGMRKKEIKLFSLYLTGKVYQIKPSVNG